MKNINAIRQVFASLGSQLRPGIIFTITYTRPVDDTRISILPDEIDASLQTNYYPCTFFIIIFFFFNFVPLF